MDDWKKVKIDIGNKKESFHKDYLSETNSKFAKGQMIWKCMSASDLGELEIINGTVNVLKYQAILKNNV